MSSNFIWHKPELSHRVNELSQEIGMPVDSWHPCQRPSRQFMSGQYCRLEPFDPVLHGDELFKAFSLDIDARNWTYLPYGPFDTKQAFHDWCSTACVDDDPLFYTLVDQSNDQITGMASYLRIAPEVGVIEVGNIHFSPLIQGTRQSTEAMYLMMRRAFEELGYRRYEWKCDALNAPSCRAAQRLGFQFEGIFRQAIMYKQRNRDTAWFSILDGDWPVLKAGYEEWLKDENFNINQQQVLSLRQCFEKQGLHC